jgi:hypothetical protein
MSLNLSPLSQLLIFSVLFIDGCTKSDETPVCYMVSNGTSTYTYNNNHQWASTNNPAYPPYLAADIYTATYDQQNRLSKITVTNQLGAAMTLQTQNYFYDANNRVVNVYIYNGTDTAAIEKVSYTYNSSGQLAVATVFNPATQSTDPNATISNYSYPNTYTHNPSGNTFIYQFFGINQDTSYYTYEYDNKVNPYVITLPESFYPEIPSNNITKQIFINDGHTQTTINTYTYTTNGYPLTEISTTTTLYTPKVPVIPPVPATTSTPITTTFTYTNCK